MDSIHDALFSPFEDATKYCVWFYGLEIYYLLAFIAGLVGLVIAGYNKKLTKSHYFLVISGLMVKLFLYAECRLLYSMCVGFAN
jgi:uncharacterized membrane protein